jgi:acyl-CoA synthetase (AMP-forming)/AMP-acid ligase II
MKDRETSKTQDKSAAPVQDTIKLNEELRHASTKPTISRDPIGALDPLVYVYTSGTTGLPKAAILKNSR